MFGKRSDGSAPPERRAPPPASEGAQIATRPQPAAAQAKPTSSSRANENAATAAPGSGTVAHLAGVRLQNVTGAKFEHIPYKGASAAVTDVAGVCAQEVCQVSRRTLDIHSIFT